MISFPEFLAQQRLKIAQAWFPTFTVETSTGKWIDFASSVSGTGAESLVAHGFETDVQTAAELLRVAMKEPGIVAVDVEGDRYRKLTFVAETA